MNCLPGKFCWNKLYVDGPAAVVGFYERLVGFSHDASDTGPMGMYCVLKIGEVSLCGAMARSMPEQAILWVPYVTVEDADATVPARPRWARRSACRRWTSPALAVRPCSSTRQVRCWRRSSWSRRRLPEPVTLLDNPDAAAATSAA